MPAPRPPKLTRPSGVEMRRASQQIAGSQRITVDRPLLLQHSPAGFHFSIDTSDWIFLARLTGVYTVTGGGQAGLNLYSFIEQSFDLNYGIPLDKNPGLQTYPQPPSIPTSAYALEVNNALLTVPSGTPAGFANPGPYVWMRLRGIIDAAPVYEFEGAVGGSGGSSTVTAVLVLSPTASTFNFNGLLTYGFPAYYPAYSDTPTAQNCWLIGDVNNLINTVSHQAEVASPWAFWAQRLGYDSNGLPVYQACGWQQAFFDSANSSTSQIAGGSGLISTGTQSIAGAKTIVSPSGTYALTAGGHYGGQWYIDGINAYGPAVCEYLYAQSSSYVGGPGLNGYGGYETVIFASGNISVVYGAITWSHNGQWPTSSYTTSLPDSQFLSMYGGVVSGASIGVGNSNIYFSGGGLTGSAGVNQPGLFIAGSGQFVEGMTGSLSDGTQVVSGLVIGAGGGGTSRTIGGSGNTYVDDGSLW